MIWVRLMKTTSPQKERVENGLTTRKDSKEVAWAMIMALKLGKKHQRRRMRLPQGLGLDPHRGTQQRISRRMKKMMTKMTKMTKRRSTTGETGKTRMRM